jgi:hypothetical protein
MRRRCDRWQGNFLLWGVQNVQVWEEVGDRFCPGFLTMEGKRAAINKS